MSAIRKARKQKQAASETPQNVTFQFPDGSMRVIPASMVDELGYLKEGEEDDTIDILD